MQILKSNILGKGKPLIILHGFLGMSDNWKTLGKEYAENGFEVHIVDQRNHGRSFHSNDFSYDLMVSDLLSYCNYHNLSSINLLGHSMGGKTAMLFAVTHPERVEKLLVADISPKYYPPHHQTILNGLDSLDFTTIDSRSDADKQLAKHIGNLGIRQFLLKNLYRKNKNEFAYRFNLKSLIENDDKIGNTLPEGSIFNKKTLFLKGDKSDYILKEDEALIKEHFPKSTIVSITNSGHWLHAENPKMFFEKSMEFLNF
ncbi:alpha/beta fold hydrolase [Abyssalbus ytuae]|uniref:Alpha/beta fold hydrolase n=1 Tax=Abyssalbus ytuae TaxID=2926907 RepID=A0A9E7CUS3_9FLAO|nr:alpha/beta fold hydrolase [Abyssalbus ytuae]UOB18882.1 alpha/beta fold hydrolase [Abyssalbus ytuae]